MFDITIIIPSYNNIKLLTKCIDSFNYFCTENIKLHFIIIENTSFIEYKDNFEKKYSRLKVIPNNTTEVGSDANASAICKGIKYCNTDLVFICHNDTLVCHENFFKELINKINEGYKLVGFRIDESRVKAIHISGLLTYKYIVNNSQIYKNNKMDVGDGITVFCRENNLNIFCFENTFNGFKLKTNLPVKKYHDYSIDKNNNIIFSHCGRGSSKKDRLTSWYKFCNSILI